MSSAYIEVGQAVHDSRFLGSIWWARQVPDKRALAPDEILIKLWPRSTRKRISRAFAALRGKRLENPWKKHDNIPL